MGVAGGVLDQSGILALVRANDVAAVKAKMPTAASVTASGLGAGNGDELGSALVGLPPTPTPGWLPWT
jgi:hypothetical protein